jgi:myo-inositol-1(or 4)-monophosphatase
MATRSALINVMSRAADKAARGLRRDFGEVEQLQVSVKGPGNFVSAADHKAEKVLRQELQHGRPDYSFLMEESGAIAGSDAEHRWIVDPLDGTTNFLHGLPHFCISIALERAGEIVAGIVFDPIKDELFWAEKGIGAYLNDRRIRVSSRRQLSNALVATGTPYDAGTADSRRGSKRYLAQLETVMNSVADIRRMGAAALDLAYVAAGRFDAYWEYGLSAWDFAAGMLLVREAGGYVSEPENGGDPLASGNVLAANDHLHAPLQSMLAQAS